MIFLKLCVLVLWMEVASGLAVTWLAELIVAHLKDKEIEGFDCGYLTRPPMPQPVFEMNIYSSIMPPYCPPEGWPLRGNCV